MRREILVLALLLVLSSSVVEAKDAVLAYRSDVPSTLCSDGTNATYCPRIRFWNSSGSGSWGPEVELHSAGGMIQHVIIRSSPATNKLVVISLGSDDTLDAFVCTINCTATSYWTAYNDIGTAETVDATRRYDFQYEEGTGDLLVAYSVASANGSRDIAYKILPNSQTDFSALTEYYINDPDHAGDLEYSWIELDRKHANSSEEIVLVAMDSTNDDVNAWVWNGSAFGNMVEISSDVSRAGTPDRREAIAVKYTYNTSRAMVLGGYGNTGDVNYRLWNGSAWSAASSFDIDAVGSTDLFWASMKADPNSDYLLTALVESNPNDMHSAFWNGSAWNVTSNIGTSLDGGGSTRPVDIEWNNNRTGLLVWGDGSGQVLWRECTPQCTGTTYTDTNYSSNTRFIGMARNPDESDYIKILAVRINNNANGPIGSFSWNDSNISNYGDSVITTSSSAQNVEIAFSIEPSAFLDAQPPVVTLVSPANNSVFTQNDLNFTFNVTDDKSLALNCSIYLDGLSNLTNASVQNGTNTNFSISGIPGGQHSWLVSCSDTAGNPANSTTWYFYIDSPPLVTLNAPANNSFVNSSTVGFNFTATDNNATTLNCSLYLDGSPNQFNPSVANGTPTVFSVLLADGLHNWSVSCTDNNNLTGWSQTWYLTIDTTLPAVTIINPANSTYNTSTVPLDYTVVEANAPSCWFVLDGGAPNYSISGCNNITLPVLGEGGHNVTVYANDSAGNTASDTEYFTIDLTPPGTPAGNIILVAPVNNSFLNVTSVTFQFNATDNLDPTLDCTLYADGVLIASGIAATNGAITSQPVIGFTEGLHNWSVSCTDDATNVGTSQTWIFTVDLTPPGTPAGNIILVAPANNSYLNVTDVTFQFNATDNLDPTLDCTLYVDGVANVTGIAATNGAITSQPVIGFTEGLHNWSVSCTDDATNVGTSQTWMFTIDLTPPGTPAGNIILVSPANNSFLNYSGVSFQFNATDNFDPTLNCTLYLDGVANVTGIAATNGAITSQAVTVPDGQHNWSVSCTDDAGNVGSSETRNFTVDTVAPIITILNPQNQTYNDSTPDLNFTVSENATCWFVLDGGAPNYSISSCNNITLPNLGDGGHNVTVFANDTAGNTNSTTQYFTIDTILPVVTIINPTNSTYNTSTPNLDFTATDANLQSCWYVLDAGSPNYSISSCNNDTLPYLADGAHNITVYANDSAGNTGSDTEWFSIDTAAPSVTIQNPLNQTYNDSTPDLNFTATDPNLDSCWYVLDGNAPVLLPSCNNITIPGPLSDGGHNVTVFANDTGGNTNSTTVYFTIDTILPVVAIINPTNSTYNTSTPALDFTAVDTNLQSCWYVLDGGAATALPGCNNITLPSMGDGGHNVTVYANDSAGNTGSDVEYFTVDTGLPFVAIQSPANSTYNSTSVPLNFTATDADLQACWYVLDADPAVYSCNNATLSGLAEGGHNVTVYANDSGGNVANDTEYFTVDSILPAVTIVNPTNSTYNTSTPDLDFTAVDTNLQSCWYVLDAGSPNYSISSCNNDTLPYLADGAHNITVYANDSAGNIGSDTEWFSIDTSPPLVTIISPTNTTYMDWIPYDFTAVDPNLDSCWYSIDGNTPVILLGCNNGSIFPPDGAHNITFFANDTFGLIGNDTEYFTKITNCPVVGTPGTFTMANDYLGAPNDASEVSNIDWACVKIASDDVIFDCNGYSITNNGTSDAAGIVINGSAGVDYTNVTIMNCPSIAYYEAGVYIHDSNGDIVQNTTAHGGFDGFNLYRSDGNTLYDNTGFNNTQSGFILTLSDNNNLSDGSAVNNGAYGFVSSTSSDNLFFDSTADNSSIGFYMILGSGNNVTECRSHGNGNMGLFARDDTSLLMERMHFWDNGYDVRLNATDAAMPYRMYNSIFDSPGGLYQNFTNLSVNDTVDDDTSYVIDWQALAAPPAGSISFEQKYVLISTAVGAGQMTSVVFHWTDAESSSQPYYNESRFYLGNYYSASWSNASAALDETANTLTLSNQILDGRFAILQLNTTDLPPAVNLISPANNSAFNITSLNLTFNTADDNSTQLNCTLNLDGSPDQTNGSVQNGSDTSFAVSALGDGTHNWSVSCTDGAMNTNTSETWEFTIDTAAPTVAIQSPANATYGTGTVDLNFTANDTSGVSQCWYVLDGNAPVYGCSNVTLGPLSNGGHNVTVYANDTLGNVGSATENFTVDTNAPTVLIIEPYNLTYAVTTINLDYIVLGANIDSCWYSLDGGANTSLPGCANDTLSGLSDGGHNVSVYANNTLGFTGYFTRYFSVDTTPPVVDIQLPANTTYNTTIIRLNYTATDDFGVVACWYVLDSGLPVLLPGCQNTTIAAGNGSHNVTVYANDSVGYISSDTEYFTVNITGGDDDDDDDGGKDTMYLSWEAVCPGDEIAFNSTKKGGLPLQDVAIKVIYNTPPNYYLVDTLDSGSDGMSDITLEQNGTYDIIAGKPGYFRLEYELEFTTCPAEDECQDDYECPGDSVCSAGQCEKVSCDCGYIENRECVAYQCCSDSECPEGTSCQANECKKIYECTGDGDCLGSEFCDIAEGEAGGACEDVTGCGEVENHALVPYEFPYGCSDPDCPVCPRQYLCQENACVFYNLTAPPSAFVGDNITLNATSGAGACQNCTIVITSPDGKKTTVQTDSEGHYVLPVLNTGSYSASLVVEGQTITSVVVAAMAKSAPVQPAKDDWAYYCLPLLLLLLILALLILWWRRKKDVTAALVTEVPAMGKNVEVKVFKTKNKEGVQNARVDIFLDGKEVAHGVTNKFGRFSFVPGAKGRYGIHVNGRKEPEATFILV